MLVIDKTPNNNELAIRILRIFDDHGNIISRIDEDGFWTEPSIRRKRPNKSSLVVYGRSDDEVLNIEFINSKALYMLGIFHDRRGVKVQIAADQIIFPRDNRVIQACLGGGGIGVN